MLCNFGVVMKNCSFTGHRVIEKRVLPHLEELLCRAIEYVYGEGCRNFYSGGALGFDMLAAKTVLKMKYKFPGMKLFIVAPCRDQSEHWQYSQRNMYDYILASADEVIYTSDDYSASCMKKRNSYLADVSDVMIAYSGRSNSGSAQTVRMAQAKSIKVFNLYKTLDDEARKQ